MQKIPVYMITGFLESGKTSFLQDIVTDEDFTEGSIDVITMLVKSGLVASRSEGRRAIEQGGVSIDGEKVTDIKQTVAKDAIGDGIVLKRGKKNFRKIVNA
jgi:tyrosyl-tRNA synthetase